MKLAGSMRRAAQMRKSSDPRGRPPFPQLPRAGVYSSSVGGAVRLGLVRHSAGAFEQRLGIEDCENGLVLRPDLARLFAPPHDGAVFSYVATIKLHSGRLWGVEVWRGDGVTGLGIGWPVLRKDLGLKPGGVAVFARGMPAGDSKFFLARFYDADGNERVDRKLHPQGPAFPDWWRAQTGAAAGSCQ